MGFEKVKVCSAIHEAGGGGGGEQSQIKLAAKLVRTIGHTAAIKCHNDSLL